MAYGVIYSNKNKNTHCENSLKKIRLINRLKNKYSKRKNIMPRKSTQSKTVSAKAESKSKTSRTKAVTSTSRSSKKETKVVDVVVDVVDEPEVSDVEAGEVASEVTKKSRRVPSRDSVDDEFTDLVSMINDEILRLRESSTKTKGVKFLRSLGKKVKTLHGHAGRVMKQKKKVKRKNNQNSGFLKPVCISNDMAKFTGWDPEQLRSRVDVTKYICNYIKENDLQNPEDRREIKADKKLQKLLGYNPKTDKPLTYYRIQTYMKNHFTNPNTDE